MEFAAKAKFNLPIYQIAFLIFFLLLTQISFGQRQREEDPDMPAFTQTNLSKEQFMRLRSEAIAERRGVEKNKPFNPALRTEAIRQMEEQRRSIASRPNSAGTSSLAAGVWTQIGPNPIPNGQVVTGSQLAVSGRTQPKRCDCRAYRSASGTRGSLG